MKRIINILLCAVLSMFLCIEKVHAVDTLRIVRVNATFLDDTVEVTRKIMEIDGGTSEMVQLNIETSGGSGARTYILIQYDGNTQHEIARTQTNRMSFDPTDVNVGLPVYLSVIDSSRQQATKMLNFRIHTGEATKQFDPAIYSEFGSGLVIDLSKKLPGCQFSFLPFSIPVTVKQYGDGRIVLGFGYNHKDVQFWNNARKGRFPAMDDFEDVRAAVLSEQKEAFWKRPHNLGVIFSISGWAEANVNPKQPVRGKVQLYVGTGVATGGQYSVLTWDIVATLGGSGAFDFAMVYNEAESKREFSFERILVSVIGAVEAFGGIGLYNLAAMGIYGAASLGFNIELLPLQDVDSLVIAGEVGYKVKVLGKSILTFTLFSGSYDFLGDKVTGTFSPSDNTGKLVSYLLGNDYANMQLPGLESGEMVWHGEIRTPPAANDDWEGDRDFAHLLAEDIYPDSHVQIVNTGSHAFPQMNAVFLSADNTRIPGNRSVLVNSYYNMATEFMSDPYPIDDDGTADYEPYVYHDPVSGNTYAVWKNAREPITEDMYLSDIASRTEIEFAEFQTGREWMNKTILTDYQKQLWCAGGATVGGDRAGEPVVCYFTSPVGDPLGLHGEHEIYLCTRDNKGNWTNEKQFTVSGNMNSVRNGWFRGAQTVSATVTDELGVSTVSLWQNGKKIWEKTNASAGQFVFGGNNTRYFLWYSDGRFYVMDNSGNESPLTPEDLRIPSNDYQFCGTLYAGNAALVGRSSRDSSENAVAIVSMDGGNTWYDTPLTAIDPNALVDHVSVAFTDQLEPVVIYSVQNYITNFDEERLDASNFYENSIESFEGIEEIRLGDDPRFTDTRADLYIKARAANTHVSLREAYVKDADDLVPGGKAEVMLAVYNNGMYPVDHASILCDDREVAQMNETLMPGQTARVPVNMTLPEEPGSEELVWTMEVTTQESGEIESRINVPVPTGHLEAGTDHIFEDMQEKMIYSVTNYGYTDKEFTVVVRDEDNDRELLREKHTLRGGTVYEGAAVSEKGMYAREGCTNVTLYVLFDGEEVGSPDIQPNRIRSVIPLEEIYGQPLPDIKIPDQLPGNEEDPVNPDQGTAPVTPVPAVTPAPGYGPAPSQQTVPGGNKDKETGKGADAETGEGEDKDSETEFGKEKETGGNEKEGEPQNGEGTKDDYSGSSSMPETEPEKKPGIPGYLWWIPVIAAGAGMIWFIVFRRRNGEEEEG